MIEPYFLKRIEQEQKEFRRVIDRYLPKELGRYRILDICSGVANEEPLLIEHFGENVEIISLDYDPSVCELSNELGRSSVRIGNVRTLDLYVQGKFDLIIGRNVPLNPNHNAGSDRIFDYWPGVFEELIRFTHTGSKLFLTLAREDEFDRAGEILNGIGYRVRVVEKNPIVVPSDYLGVRGADTKDNYVIIAQFPLQLRLF